jgi:predicted metal-binding membrane protein
MSDHSFATSFSADRTPQEAFDAITNVRGWWPGEIDGGTTAPGDEFLYGYGDVHRCTIRVTEVIPGRNVSWRVVENCFDFTHHGLVPENECATGEGLPSSHGRPRVPADELATGRGQQQAGRPIDEPEIVTGEAWQQASASLRESESQASRAGILAALRYQLPGQVPNGPDGGSLLRHDSSSTRTAARAAALTATLGLAAACWVVTVRQMNGMDMGVATQLGSLAFFVTLWMPMMAAMMLPGAAPAVLRRAHASGVRAVPLFVGSYLAVWALVGVAVYAVYRPHGSVAAGAVTIAAGVYELTPLKQHFRRRGRESVRSGFEFGLCCAGSSIGLMLILVALGVMSVTWMSVTAILVIAQKLLPARAAIDVPLALAIMGLGIVTVIAPSWVPGLMPPM